MKKLIIVAAIIVLAAVAILIVFKKDTDPVSRDNTIRVGYIIYPPLLTQDGSTGKLSGVSYDLVEAVAQEIGVEVDWTEEVGWGTALEGLKTNRYDVLGTQMWPNEAREKVASFSIAPMNSVLYPYVKSGDTRFSADNLDAINSSSVTVSALDGEMAVFIANEDYPSAKLNSLPQLSSYAEVFLNIVQKKADITFVEPSAAEDFLKSQPGTIERLGDIPVRSFGNSFAFAKDNAGLMKDWNKALRKLTNDGTIENILEKYEVSSHYKIN
jgi:ABC-type amino acid transport substrate-binding protein